MTDRQRVALLILIFAVIVFLGFLFAPFVIEHILEPLSVAVWLFLRIFILSIDQGLYWAFLILIALFWLARRLVVRGSEPVAMAVAAPNDAVLNIEKWFNSITLAVNYPNWRDQLKSELIQMLIGLFFSRQQEVTFPEINDMLRQRQIPIPDPVYDFLFASQAKDQPLTFVQKIRSLPALPRKWWRRWSGRDTIEFHRSVDIVLNFMETMLENPDDYEPSNNSKH